jgi:hypothetical protein
MDRSTRVSPVPHATFRRLGGEAGGVLLHLETAAYFRLNGLGVHIWEQLGSGTTVGLLVDQLRTEYDPIPETLEQDTAEFLQALADRDLVRLEPDDH